MQINRYVNGERTKNFEGRVIENEAVKEVMAEAERRAKKAQEKE